MTFLWQNKNEILFLILLLFLHERIWKELYSVEMKPLKSGLGLLRKTDGNMSLVCVHYLCFLALTDLFIYGYVSCSSGFFSVILSWCFFFLTISCDRQICLQLEVWKVWVVACEVSWQFVRLTADKMCFAAEVAFELCVYCGWPRRPCLVAVSGVCNCTWMKLLSKYPDLFVLSRHRHASSNKVKAFGGCFNPKPKATRHTLPFHTTKSAVCLYFS